jgi:hypothetical protein
MFVITSGARDLLFARRIARLGFESKCVFLKFLRNCGKVWRAGGESRSLGQKKAS